MDSLPRIIVAICTYKRNEPLRTLLSALVKVAAETEDRARVGVVVVDDNPDRRAEAVVAEFQDAFSLGIRYRASGKANISIARNLAVNTALEDADWIAMIDDDCEPEPDWLNAYLDVLEKTGADCAFGAMNLRVPPGSPAWLTEQPFFDDIRFDYPEGTSTNLAATNNSIIRADFLRGHPEIRFEPRYGKLGGEDMIFYRSAHNAGLKICFTRKAGVWGNEPPERATFKHLLNYRFWLGNSMFVTNHHFGDSKARLFLRGGKLTVQASLRPLSRLMRGNRPQWRYSVASFATGLGLMSGAVGYLKQH
jgi:glycosyltransferase involved in cell wall biosynthesis